MPTRGTSHPRLLPEAPGIRQKSAKTKQQSRPVFQWNLFCSQLSTLTVGEEQHGVVCVKASQKRTDSIVFGVLEDFVRKFEGLTNELTRNVSLSLSRAYIGKGKRTKSKSVVPVEVISGIDVVQGRGEASYAN